MVGTLTLGLSPLFMPLAASFMSDVPGLFVIVLCLYCCQRAITAGTDRAAVAWLCFAAASNVAGGTARQIAWLGVLVMVPSTAWLLRKRRGVFLAASLCWAASVVGVFYSLHWFAAQPYAVAGDIFKVAPIGTPASFVSILFAILGEFLAFIMLAFPILAAWLPRIRKARGATLGLSVCILLFFAALQWETKWTLPWVGHVIRTEFSSARAANTSQPPGHFILGKPACSVLSLLVIAAFLAFATTIRIKLRYSGNSAEPAPGRRIFWLLGPFFLSYCTLLLLLLYHRRTWILDRYLLGILPVAIIVFIWLYQRTVAPGLPAISVVTVAILGVLAIAGTHDWFAWQRARLAAIRQLRAQGIPRTAIAGGFEYDGWTQIESAGHINDPRIKVPPGAYQPRPMFCGSSMGARFCRPSTPAVHPKYFVAFKPSPCLVPSKFGPVYFCAWLPPFRRAIYVKQLPKLRR